MSFQIQTAVVNGEAAEAPTPGTAAGRRRGAGGGGGAVAQSGAASEQSTVARSEALEALAEPSWIRVAVAKP